jgi:hypothetical protein
LSGSTSYHCNRLLIGALDKWCLKELFAAVGMPFDGITAKHLHCISLMIGQNITGFGFTDTTTSKAVPEHPLNDGITE